MSITEEAVRSLEARAEDAEIKAREACEKLRSFESSNDTLMQERHALKIALEHKEAMQVTLHGNRLHFQLSYEGTLLS